LKASFTVHDYEGHIDSLINFAAIIKSPQELVDTWLKAVIRGRIPLAYKQVRERYWDALHHINTPAELA